MRNEEKQMIFKKAITLLIGAAVGAAVSMMMLFLVAVVFAITKRLPQMAVIPIALVAAAIGTFVAGYVVGRIKKKNGYIYGLAEGILLFAVWVLFSMSTGNSVTVLLLIRFGIMIVTGMLGGIVGVNRKRRFR